MSVSNAPVVVGIDGSVNSPDAVRYAADVAAGSGRALRIVHANVWPLVRIGTPPGVPKPSVASLSEQSEAGLAEAAEAAAEAAPGIPVRTELITGSPAPVLIERSRDAGLVVVGDRGLGSFSG